MKVISLFSGCGGLDLGFEKAGFEIPIANEFDKTIWETFKINHPKTKLIEGDIGQVDFNSIPKTPFIIGGFPCQGFSLAGPRKLDDKRNILYRYYVKLVEENQPHTFVA